MQAQHQVSKQPQPYKTQKNSSRGLDSGRAKWAPKADGRTQKGHRRSSRRLSLFVMQCKRKGRDSGIDGVFLVVSLWKEFSLEATEQQALTNIELDENPVNPLFELLDQIFQREDLINAPNRCDKFFAEFYRRDAGVKATEHSWRSPKRLEWKVQSCWEDGICLAEAASQNGCSCNGDLESEEVVEPLLRAFGGYHKPNAEKNTSKKSMTMTPRLLWRRKFLKKW